VRPKWRKYRLLFICNICQKTKCVVHNGIDYTKVNIQNVANSLPKDQAGDDDDDKSNTDNENYDDDHQHCTCTNNKSDITFRVRLIMCTSH